MARSLPKRFRVDDSSMRGAGILDEDLLDRFLSGDELESQDAFRALVGRHGPGVLRICRHVLDQDHDVEDAFQATFLVLARKGASIRNGRVLAAWLGEVAHRVAMRSRARTGRRRYHETRFRVMVPPREERCDPAEEICMDEFRPALHEEVARLPEKYRLPVILSYLEGKTNEEIAELLQWPVGTVKGRLARGRAMLRDRLERRGLAVSTAFLVFALSQNRAVAGTIPAGLVTRTVELATKRDAHAVPPESAASPSPGPANPARSPANIGPVASRLLRLALVSFWLLALISSLNIATSWAAGSDGSFPDMRAAFLRLIQGSGTGTRSCH